MFLRYRFHNYQINVQATKKPNASAAAVTGADALNLETADTCLNVFFVFSVSYQFEEHVHDTHGHKTTSSEHVKIEDGELKERQVKKGSSPVCSVVLTVAT